jgi:hypothetical protein
VPENVKTYLIEYTFEGFDGVTRDSVYQNGTDPDHALGCFRFWHSPALKKLRVQRCVEVAHA